MTSEHCCSWKAGLAYVTYLSYMSFTEFPLTVGVPEFVAA